MPEVFESFTRSDAASTPSTQQRAQGPLVETSASDLGELASRAQQRQRKLLDTSRKLGSNIFPAQNEPGAMPNLLGGSGQPQGIKGVANVIPNRNKVNHNDVSKRSGQIDAADLGFAPPVEKPKALEDRPLDVGYAALTPTQRNQALRSLKVDVKNFAQNPDTGEPWRTGSGATILAFDSKLSGAEDLFLAEDAIAAHSVVFGVVRDAGIKAVPSVRGGSDRDDHGYAVEWDIELSELERFRHVMDELGPDSVLNLGGGKMRVTFSAEHKLNSFFSKSPFGSKEPLDRPLPAKLFVSQMLENGKKDRR